MSYPSVMYTNHREGKFSYTQQSNYSNDQFKYDTYQPPGMALLWPDGGRSVSDVEIRIIEDDRTRSERIASN